MQYPYLSDLLNGHLSADFLERERLPWEKENLRAHLTPEMKEGVKEELQRSYSDPGFSWKGIGSKTNFINKWRCDIAGFDTYVTEIDVFNYFKLIMWDILYPEIGYSEFQYEKIKRSVFYILRDMALLTPDWIPVDFIVNCMHAIDKEWRNVESFHMEYLQNHSRYEIVAVERGAPYPLPNFFGMIPIKKMRLWEAYMNPDIELIPNLFIEDISDDELEKGLLIKDFIWPVDNTRLVHSSYNALKTSKNG